VPFRVCDSRLLMVALTLVPAGKRASHDSGWAQGCDGQGLGKRTDRQGCNAPAARRQAGSGPHWHIH